MMLDAFAQSVNATWEDKRYGMIAKCRIKSAEIVLLKPSTYMNLSGNAVRYWLQQEKIPVENMLVLVDDLNLPFGSIRMRKKGSNGGHNGLGNIIQTISTQQFARLRFGIGNDFPMGAQIKFVLDPFFPEEKKILEERIPIAAEAVKNFCLSGLTDTMCKFNNK
jgi:PTH1 family peptidyl-tRNA hydrolase